MNTDRGRGPLSRRSQLCVDIRFVPLRHGLGHVRAEGVR